MKKAIILGAFALFPHSSQAQLIDTVCEDTARLEKQLFGTPSLSDGPLGADFQRGSGVMKLWDSSGFPALFSYCAS